MPNLDPKQMEKMMRQMGINSKQLDAKKVVIEAEGQNIIITSPQVTEITMQGQKSYQIAGNVSIETPTSEEDISMVVEQTGKTREEAAGALKKANGDIAQAILLLQEK
ncbi:MAG: nascent polypeptide-associated complex protein [Candidatus Micrarchaeia archaeon]